jgi:hypothetical protein
MKGFVKIQQAALLFALILMATSSVFAQGSKSANMTQAEKAQALTKKQNERIHFSDGQEKQMYDINLKYVKEMEKISAGGRSMSTMRKLKSMGDEKDKEVKKVLNGDQYSEYLEQKQEMQEQMKANRG